MADQRNANRQGSNRQGSNRHSANRQGSSRQGGNRQGGNRQGSSRQSANRQGGSQQGSIRQGASLQGGGLRTAERHSGNGRRAGNEGSAALWEAAARDVRAGADRVALHNRRDAALLALVPGVLVGALLVAVIGALASLAAGLVTGIVACVATSLFTWYASAPVLLRWLGAVPTSEEELPRLYNLVDGICATMGLEMPEIRLLDADWPDALVLGGPHRRVDLVVTRGLVDGLSLVQLEGVLAHELVHVNRAEVARGTIAAAIALPVAALGPRKAASLVHVLAGRGREMSCDQSAVRVTRYPPGLRDALEAIAAHAGAGRAGPGVGGRTGRVASGVLGATNWLWTVAIDPPDDPDSLAGELDAPGIRIAALAEL